MRIALSAIIALTMGIGSLPAHADELLEQVATVINLNGHLCARVTDVRPLEQSNTYEVTCIEYRGGSGTVRYIMNAATGVAFKAG
ncbi:hypothetical protein M3484_22480 [Pseudomonas sp. GX19020]|uniref:hypothetical protein n=1 Tax=Pseudomonas sp. GX19020 TaxID=2942277 RepID=UPI002019A925|nr:hypothetical protein [Pseudomonas sp. GX19020]MCL4069329.1 hypothetical protein [Pseudomonas sp. GX19020]